MPLQPHPQRILLPVKVSFIVLTLALGLLFDLLPWGTVPAVPDLTATVLAFWCIHQPRRVGIAIAWTLGLLIDVGNGSLLGQHALAYSVLAFLAFAVHRRILWFPPWQQALHLLPLLLFTRLLMLVIRIFVGADFPGWIYFGGCFISAALWPVLTFLLLLPQRQAETIDENRPI
ncbi:MAG TPA: rod shape-determining protein MreD [Burkholderiales bacterium]|nr:rod shape-determining protein MreD [Burkholderiales bacterium]